MGALYYHFTAVVITNSLPALSDWISAVYGVLANNGFGNVTLNGSTANDSNCVSAIQNNQTLAVLFANTDGFNYSRVVMCGGDDGTACQAIVTQTVKLISGIAFE